VVPLKNNFIYDLYIKMEQNSFDIEIERVRKNVRDLLIIYEFVVNVYRSDIRRAARTNETSNVPLPDSIEMNQIVLNIMANKYFTFDIFKSIITKKIEVLVLNL